MPMPEPKRHIYKIINGELNREIIAAGNRTPDGWHTSPKEARDSVASSARALNAQRIKAEAEEAKAKAAEKPKRGRGRPRKKVE